MKASDTATHIDNNFRRDLKSGLSHVRLYRVLTNLSSSRRLLPDMPNLEFSRHHDHHDNSAVKN